MYEHNRVLGESGHDGREIRVIGCISVTIDGSPVDLQRGQQQLLALLVAAGPDGASADRLADEIWLDNLPQKWPNTLRVSVSRLRKRTGLSIQSSGGGYRLDVPVEQVDAWRLLDGDGTPTDELDPLLAETEAFPLVEPTPSIRTAADRIGAAQRALIERMAESGRVPSRQVLEVLGRHLEYDPCDESLTYAIAKIHALGGAPAVSLGLIDQCHGARLGILDSGRSARLDALASDIRSQHAALEPEIPETRPSGLPAPLERYAQHHFVGRVGELDELGALLDQPSAGLAVVRGNSGSGKTALLAETGRLAVERHHHVVYLAGTEGGKVGLAPLRSGVAGFSEQIEQIDRRDLDPAGRMGLLADRLIATLQQQALERPVLLLVDDAHWLDSPTAELLHYLIRSSHGLNVVMATRSQTRNKSPWAALERGLDRIDGCLHLSPGPLSMSELASIVGHRRPEMTFAGRDQITRWLHHASAGLPAVAMRILDSGLESSMGRPTVNDVFDHLIASLDEETAEVASAAAVMGRDFRLSNLIALLEQDEADLVDVLDDLIRRDLVMETESLDRFEFSHQLVVEACLRSHSVAWRARLHLKACDLTTDVHALARHRVAARDLVPRDLTVTTVIESARLHLSDREFWESAAGFRVAVGLDETALGPSVFVDFATALSLSGARGAGFTMRKRAFDAALAARDWDAAVDAACSGLPEAEVPDGEADRLDMLRVIPQVQLSPEKRLVQAVTAARLGGQLGRRADARKWAAHAKALAATDEEVAEAALGERFIDVMDVPPTERLERLDDAVAGLELSPRAACRAGQYRAIDRLELGQMDQAEVELKAFAAQADELEDPLRQWHAQVFDALLHEVRGELNRADALADEARAFARRFGITQADIVRLSQRYFRFEATGQLAALSDGVENVPVEDADSSLFGAAKSNIQLAAGRSQEAVDTAERLARSALERPSVTGHGCLALLAPVLALHPSRPLRAEVRQALEPFAGRSMVMGIGIGLIGSIDLLLAGLDGIEGADLERALGDAIGLVDANGFRSHSVRYRLELAQLTGSRSVLDEAIEVADGTDLNRFLSGSGPSER